MPKSLLDRKHFAWLELRISQTLAKPVIVQHYCAIISGIDAKMPISLLQTVVAIFNGL